MLFRIVFYLCGWCTISNISINLTHIQQLITVSFITNTGKTWWSVGKKSDVQSAPTQSWFDTQAVRALTDRFHYGDGWTARPNWVQAVRGTNLA